MSGIEFILPLTTCIRACMVTQTLINDQHRRKIAFPYYGLDADSK